MMLIDTCQSKLKVHILLVKVCPVEIYNCNIRYLDCEKGTLSPLQKASVESGKMSQD